MTRKEILDKACVCVNGQRQQDYGTPENNFQTIADLWNDYIKGSGKEKLDATDVSMMMALLKIARIGTGKGTADSFIDLAGYAACGGEIATTEAAENSPHNVFARVRCGYCGKTWTAIAPENTPVDTLECPACHRQGKTEQVSPTEQLLEFVKQRIDAHMPIGTKQLAELYDYVQELREKATHGEGKENE